jgi:hypothetical protein
LDHLLETRSIHDGICLSMSYPGIHGKQLYSSPVNFDTTSTNRSLRIHAPHFYRRMITYSKLADLLQDVLLDPHHENRAAWSDDASGLIMTIRAREEQLSREISQPTASASGHPIPKLHNIENSALKWLWKIHARLRRITPLPGVYPDPGLPSSRGRGPSNNPHPGGNATLSEWQAELRPTASTIKYGYSADCFLDQFVHDKGDPRLQLKYMLATLLLQWRTTLAGIMGGE